MPSEEVELIELLNILAKVIDANKDEESKEGLRALDTEGLALKFFGHAVSTLYLHRGLNVPGLVIPIANVPDPLSVDVLVRAALETFLVFYYIFIESSDKNEIDLRYRAWELAGLYKRQTFPAYLEENIEKLQKEQIWIEQLKEKIKTNPIFMSYEEKKKNNFFKQLEKGYWRYKGWAKIALSAGFSKLNSEIIYSFLCEHVHSGNISATQVWQSYDFEIRRNLMKSSIDYLNICTANMIKYYCQYFPKSGEYYTENHQEPNIVTLWMEIGQEANIKNR